MSRLLAEDLLLLCWNTDKGTAAQACADKLDAGIGGALVLDALRADALGVRDGRATPTATPADDPLLAEVVAQASRGRRAPTVKTLVGRVGTASRRQQILDRLVNTGMLRRHHKRVLGIIPLTRHHLADPRSAAALTATVRELLTGTRSPDDVGAHHLLLAALSGPTGVIDTLVDRSQRQQARRRAEEFSEGHGIPAAVGQTIADTQLAIIAAVATVVTTNHGTSSSNTGS